MRLCRRVSDFLCLAAKASACWRPRLCITSFPTALRRIELCSAASLAARATNRFSRLRMKKLSALFVKSFGQIIELKADPLFTRVYRWNGAMAQYGVGHLERLQRIESLLQQLPAWRWPATDTAESECPIASAQEARQQTACCSPSDWQRQGQPDSPPETVRSTKLLP